MTSDASDGEIASAEAFETALGRLLDEALRNGVDPRGAWEHRAGEFDPDWEVMIHELSTGPSE